MNDAPRLRQLAHQMMSQQVGRSQDSDELAIGAVTVYTTLLTRLSSLVGVLGSTALLRRSLRLTQAAFPCYTEVLGDEQNGLLNALSACLRKQAPDVAREASVALLTAYLELLAALIGERLTRQLLQETWPDLQTSPSQENHA